MTSTRLPHDLFIPFVSADQLVCMSITVSGQAFLTTTTTTNTSLICSFRSIILFQVCVPIIDCKQFSIMCLLQHLQIIYDLIWHLLYIRQNRLCNEARLFYTFENNARNYPNPLDALLNINSLLILHNIYDKSSTSFTLHSRG